MLTFLDLNNILSSDDVINFRSGSVLIRNTLLKADHFPGCQNLKLTPNFKEAPNFRKVEDLPVYGLGCPSATGIKIILDVLRAEKGKRKVIWNNMREEPLIYINGDPFVVRESDRPFANLEYTGICRSRVEEMEKRLKQDVLSEMKKYKGKVLLSDENEDCEVKNYWEKVDELNIQTPVELYEDLIKNGYDIDYLRIPVTDEKAPKATDFDILTKRCWSQSEGSVIIFNCQMGRGRTTTGMVIASLLYLRKLHAFPISSSISNIKKIPRWFREINEIKMEKTEFLKLGMYNVVRSLLRILERGNEGKAVLDRVIDNCSDMQNLREAILAYRDKMFSESQERKRNDLLTSCMEYLERYCFLIAFTSYISHPNFDPSSNQNITFDKFMAERPVFNGIIKRLIHRNPFSALELEKKDNLLEERKIKENEISDIKDKRNGKVLGANTILKEEYSLSKHHHESIIQEIEDVPNFRSVLNLPVYGVAMTTITGIEFILEKILTTINVKHILWHNLREEPVVFINGNPFVLREERRPFKNLKEYIQISKKHIEKMELRLKHDIIKEAMLYGGKILIASEKEEDGSVNLVKKWEQITNVDSVQTPAEVFQMLQSQGYPITYFRVPNIDDVDQMIKNFEEKGNEDETAFIFSCQSGVSHTTFGMVLGCLFKLESQNSQCIKAFQHITEKQFQKIEEEEFKEMKMEGKGNDPDYFAVNRIVRLLDSNKYKSTVDRVIDASASIINLRDILSKIHHNNQIYINPENKIRDHTFSRKVIYLKRYCLLIVTDAYLKARYQSHYPHSFKDWIYKRSDIRLALKRIGQYPTESLKVMPTKLFHHLNSNWINHSFVSNEVELSVLNQRHGNILTSWTVLKTDHIEFELDHHHHHFYNYNGNYNAKSSSNTTNININTNLCYSQIIPDMRKVQDKQIYTIGNPDVETLKRLLCEFGAGPNGTKYVVLTDIREELYVYINGKPCVRRDLERPLSFLCNAGITVTNLEKMESVLKQDIINEAKLWKNHILLHKEFKINSNNNSNKSWNMKNYNEKMNSIVVPVWSNPILKNDKKEEVLNLLDTKELFEELKRQGYKIYYKRIPLSKEREIMSDDFDVLEALQLKHEIPNCIISRTVDGTSAKYVSAFICCYQDWYLNQQKLNNTSMNLNNYPKSKSAAVISDNTKIEPFFNIISSNLKNCNTYNSSTVSNKAIIHNISDIYSIGDYSGILNLCRLEKNGLYCKASVDISINACYEMGNILEDILSCKNLYDKDEEGKNKALALGLLYLKRYFMLVAYRCYLEIKINDESLIFSDWLRGRKEILHLFRTLDLNR